MFDKFTALARQAIIQAQEEAISLGHDFIGCEHILLGLTEVTDGTAAAILTAHGVTPDRTRTEITRLARPIEPSKPRRGQASHGGKGTLAAIGIDVEEIRRRADATFGPGQFLWPRLPGTQRAGTAMKLSWEAAQAQGLNYIATQHFLLGLLTEGEHGPAGYAIQILNAIGADPAQLRAAALARTGETPDT